MVFCISIITNFSFFYLILIFFVSCLLSYFLYKSNTNLVNVPKHVVLFLSFLRFLSFFLLFFLLFKPELRKQEKILDPPLIVFLQDNSSSILLGSDSLYYKSEYLHYLDSLSNLDDLNIDIIAFDNIIRKKIDFSGQSTNISNILNQVSNNYANLNVGAYVLISDGVYNEGVNPLYSSIKLNAPLYTVLIGDTIQHKDIILNSIRHNKITYLNNNSPIEVVINVDQMKGESFMFEVFNYTQDPKCLNPIYNQKININHDNDAYKLQFFIVPETPGIQTYYARVKSNTAEKNLTNNNKFFFIDVMDDRQKILLLFSSPHPDISAIKSSLESYDQYEVVTYWCSLLNNKSFEHIKKSHYNLIITHQLLDLEYLTELKGYADRPIWHIVGSSTDIPTFNKMQNFVQFENIDNAFEFADVALNQNFSSFMIDDSLSDFLSFSTPFLTPFSDFKINYLSDALLYKKIGSLNTEKPMMFFVDSHVKSAFLLGEGLWRWRLNDTYLNGNTYLFNHLLSKIIQNLLSDEDKNRFHVNYNSVQNVGEQISFEAQLYNQNFELVNSYDIDMELKDSLGQQYHYQFMPMDNYYHLDLDLEKGEYSFIARTQLGNESFVKKGNLVIADFDIESRDLVANHGLLSDLAQTNNGYLIEQDSLSQLINNIKIEPTFKTRRHLAYSYQSLINFKSVLLLILITLFLEWLVRRRYINY